MKQDITKREQCFKRLQAKDKRKFGFTLDRLQLPSEFENQQPDEEAEVSCVEKKTSAGDLELALVPYENKVEGDVEDDFSKILESPPMEAPRTPPRVDKRWASPSETTGFSSADIRAAKRLSMQSVGMRFSDSPQAFQQQMAGQVDPKTGLGNAKPKSLDEDLLKAAMQHVPKEADVKTKGPKVLKRPSMMKRPAAAEGGGNEPVMKRPAFCEPAVDEPALPAEVVEAEVGS